MADGCKPTQECITVAAARHGGGWLVADEITSQLKCWGFDVTPQWLSSQLGAMCRETIPRFERKETPWGIWAYKLTDGGGRTYLHNIGFGGLDRRSWDALYAKSAEFFRPDRVVTS